jgi:hypothetical protein
MLLVLELNPGHPGSPMLYRLSYFGSKMAWIGFISLRIRDIGRIQPTEEDNSMPE